MAKALGWLMAHRAAALGLVTAVAVAVVVVGALNRAPRPATAPRNAPALERFGIFTSDRTQRPSPAAANRLAQIVPGETLDTSTARTVVDTLGDQISVIGGANHICMSIQTATGGGSADCAPAAHAADPRFPMGEVGFVKAAHGYRVLFLLPDGIDSVELATEDGGSRTVPVRDNIVSAVLPAIPSTMTFGGPGGSHQTLDLSQTG
jgi:hypothetical protein